MLSDDEKRQRINQLGERCPVCEQGYSVYYPSLAPPTWEVNSTCGHLLATEGQGSTHDAHRVLFDPSSWRWEG